MYEFLKIFSNLFLWNMNRKYGYRKDFVSENCLKSNKTLQCGLLSHNCYQKAAEVMTLVLWTQHLHMEITQPWLPEKSQVKIQNNEHEIMKILWILALFCHGLQGQIRPRDQMTIMEIINATEQLSEVNFGYFVDKIEFLNSGFFQFAKVLRFGGLHQAFLERPITLFAPTNDAMRKFKGRKDENHELGYSQIRSNTWIRK